MARTKDLKKILDNQKLLLEETKKRHCDEIYNISTSAADAVKQLLIGKDVTYKTYSYGGVSLTRKGQVSEVGIGKHGALKLELYDGTIIYASSVVDIKDRKPSPAGAEVRAILPDDGGTLVLRKPDGTVILRKATSAFRVGDVVDLKTLKRLRKGI